MQAQPYNLKAFSLVVAYSKNRGIGFQGGFPWPMIPKDLKHFARVTQMKDLGLSMADIARQRVFFQSGFADEIAQTQASMQTD